MYGCAVAILLSGNVYANENSKAKHDGHHAGMSSPMMDEKAMQKMMEMGSPGENHKLLEPMVGEWTHTVKMQMAPNAPVEESTGTNSNKWIMDGRFIQSDVEGTMNMGDKSQPFAGMAIMGYDNMNKEFNSIWIDNMMTGIMSTKGKYNPKTKTITEKGLMSCPMTGEKNKAFRSEIKFIDNDNYSYSMFVKDKSGKEFKSIEVVYKRKQ